MRRSRLWLIAALVLVVLAGWLLSRSDDIHTPPKIHVEIPHRMRPKEHRRMVRRRVLPPPKPSETKRLVARPRDPLLAALPGGPGATAVVFEANALRNSPVGKLLLDCMTRLKGQSGPFHEIQNTFGIDPLEDVDRVAITPHGMIVTGNFKNAHWNELPQSSAPQPYGDAANLYHLGSPLPDGGTLPSRMAAATWNHQLLFFGDSSKYAQAAIDRIEGRAPANPPLSENQTYGEIYGVLSASDFQSIFHAGRDPNPLVRQLVTTAQKVELHVDARSDVGVEADVIGPNGEQMDDLGRSMAGALSAARLEAQSQGDDRLSQFLDFARVDPNGGNFKLDLALPLNWIQKQLAWCEDPSLPLPAGLAPLPEASPLEMPDGGRAQSESQGPSNGTAHDLDADGDLGD